MADWMPTDEEKDKVRHSERWSHLYPFADAIGMLYTRKLVEWLGEICYEHSIGSGYPPDMYRVRRLCPECMAQLRREVGLDG